jgi:hypothetical protein
MRLLATHGHLLASFILHLERKLNAQMRYLHIDRKILQVVCEMRPTGYVTCLKCRIFLVLAFTSFGSSVHEVFFVTIIRIPDRAVWFRRVGRENSEVGTED